jgi:uncharacterized protein YjbJ (UPF0337 family)
MGERMDELKGNVKEGVGKLTGDEGLEAEGEAESSAAKASRETKGAARQAVGSVKEGFGKLTDDEATEAEGKADRLRGKADQLG